MSLINSEVKVVFLDAGGVLFDTPVKGEERIRRLLKGRGYKISDIDKAIQKAKLIKPEFITTWSEEEAYYKTYYGAIAEELKDNSLTEELLFFTHFAGHCELFPEVRGVLEKLSKRYRLGVISNSMPSMDWVFDRLDIRKYFEALVLSAFVKTEKPGGGIFKIALAELEARPEEGIFVDDLLENIQGADREGIKGLYLDRTKEDLQELLEKSGIL
ncbi:HAD-IA family hydrolase [Rossellomorea vietnamensis]|uniref:HAD-IA family hydrolase n=1 Tax=Rossellomorea vietnamensis TaxID=218284 RepID=A0A5D4NXJ0_9BACI|nr:HAD-IA family hydrolase [Rossellomorea vietnamensis]TYS18569.1 HAD-IA family hydrolase [Rossellomorea vietnamensis]